MHPKARRRKKSGQQEEAKERIQELFGQAATINDQKLSDRYVTLARKLSMKYKVPFTKEQKLSFCKGCSSYLNPAKNARIRVSDGKVKVLCLNCKRIGRYGYR